MVLGLVMLVSPLWCTLTCLSYYWMEIKSKSYQDILLQPVMHTSGFVDYLTFHLASSSGQHFKRSNTFVYNLTLKNLMTPSPASASCWL